MEEEETRDYNEPCAQCSEVNWGLTDESKFYCRSCHNVIDRGLKKRKPNLRKVGNEYASRYDSRAYS
uniref:TATA box-binding protein-associated factor RNA polymerase I subunit B n=1 Tax=Sphaerodactylus townsendi TaxID=933632 RepID=A0ACB8GDI7_9SAUR